MKVGDVVQAARRDRTIIYVAHELLEKRVSAPLAAAAVLVLRIGGLKASARENTSDTLAPAAVVQSPTGWLKA
mgnify:CR=1 FL=1